MLSGGDRKRKIGLLTRPVRGRELEYPAEIGYTCLSWLPYGGRGVRLWPLTAYPNPEVYCINRDVPGGTAAVALHGERILERGETLFRHRARVSPLHG